MNNSKGPPPKFYFFLKKNRGGPLCNCKLKKISIPKGFWYGPGKNRKIFSFLIGSDWIFIGFWLGASPSLAS